MTMTDPVADMLTRLRNANSAHHDTVSLPGSKLKSHIAEILKREGYIRGFERQEPEPGKPELQIELKYHEGEPVIRAIDRVSTPGRRVYSSISDLPRVCNGLGISILSTPQGVLSDGEARAANVGGEVLCSVL